MTKKKIKKYFIVYKNIIIQIYIIFYYLKVNKTKK